MLACRLYRMQSYRADLVDFRNGPAATADSGVGSIVDTLDGSEIE